MREASGNSEYIKTVSNIRERLEDLENLFQNCLNVREKQAGTSSSRRHIQGSKIAEGLPSVILQYSKVEKQKI